MIKVGLIGIGKMGKNHLRVLSELDNCQLSGISDINTEEATRLAREYNVPYFENLDDLLEKSDALVIATPTSTHFEIATKAIQAGKHILVEKPLAETYETAKRIADEAEKKNIKLMVGHVERFNPVVQELKKIIKNKNPLIISITRVGPFPPRIKDTGIILDMAIHDIDILHYLVEKEPKSLNCYKNRVFGEHEDTAIISFKFDGCLAHIITNWLTPFKVRKIEVATEEEYFVGDLIDQKLTQFSRYTEEGAYVSYEVPIRHKEPLKEELKEFVKSILEDREPAVTGKIAAANIAIAEKCLGSEA